MTTLQLVALIAAALAAMVHSAFFVLESVLFHRPVGRRVFGVRAGADSAPLRLFAVNQGIYNLGLAIVVIIGVALVAIDPGSIAAVAVTVTGCAVMTLAGLTLALTAPRRILPIAFVQGIPPLIAISALLLGR